MVKRVSTAHMADDVKAQVPEMYGWGTIPLEDIGVVKTTPPVDVVKEIQVTENVEEKPEPPLRKGKRLI